MIDNRKRGPDGTVQRRVFLVIKAGARTRGAIAEAADITPEAASKACYYLKLRGLIARRAGLKWAEWEPVPGAREPKDRRGKPKRCRNHRGPKAYASWVAMMRGKHGDSWRPPVPPIPVDGTPLAQCWRSPVGAAGRPRARPPAMSAHREA